MSRNNPAKQYHSYEVMTQEDPETGDVIVPIPPQVLKELGWKEGDEMDIQLDSSGKVIIKKVDK